LESQRSQGSWVRKNSKSSKKSYHNSKTRHITRAGAGHRPCNGALYLFRRRSPFVSKQAREQRAGLRATRSKHTILGWYGRWRKPTFATCLRLRCKPLGSTTAAGPPHRVGPPTASPTMLAIPPGWQPPSATASGRPVGTPCCGETQDPSAIIGADLNKGSGQRA
jgi:hypothetical protein